ncbi:MAG: zinc ribbon domain-containing protein [Opitutaceae bacterium]|jgi:hypothetical protein
MKTPKPSFRAPSECPVCGAEVPRGARACPECGADERSGWNEEETRYDGVDLPGEDEGGFDSKRSAAFSCLRRSIWKYVGLLLLLALAWLFLRGRF